MSTNTLKVRRIDLNTAALRPALDKTPHDHHFGENYRFRSMSRFEATSEPPGFRKLEGKPLFQSGQINPIKNYGGIYRDYVDLPDELIGAEDFQRMVRLWLEELPVPMPRFSVHHIRTLAPGAPTPEGRHRDGYEFVGIGVLQRQGIEPNSAVTRFWSRDKTEQVFEQVLHEGDFVIFDDRNHLHATSDVHLAADALTGTRDVLIFTVPDHGEISDGTEVQR
jgi:hypothetical protein